MHGVIGMVFVTIPAIIAVVPGLVFLFFCGDEIAFQMSIHLTEKRRNVHLRKNNKASKE